MSDLDRLHEIIDGLPPQQVHALLILLVPPEPISPTFAVEGDFMRNSGGSLR
jgi:hypothetical protein